MKILKKYWTKSGFNVVFREENGNERTMQFESETDALEYFDLTNWN